MNRLTEDRAIRRYLQVRLLEETVEKIEASLEDVQKEIDDATDRQRSLRKEKSEALKAMRDAAKDEGQLPLFGELTDDLVDLGIPREWLLQPGAPRA